MEKAILLKKLKFKYLIPKSKRLKRMIEKNLKISHFLLEVSDSSSMENYNELLKTYKKSKKEDLLSVYKQSILLLESITTQIDILNLKPCQDKALRAYQLKMADFMNEMADFFAKNGLEYFMMGGTLIGALRHKGFVPWDDDIDIGMLRKDYEALKKILKDNFVEVDTSAIGFNTKNQLSIINKTLKNYSNQMVFFIGPRYLKIYKGSSIKNSVKIDVFPHDYYHEDYSIEEYNKYCAEMNSFCLEVDNFQKLVNSLDEIRLNNKNIVEKSNKISYGIDCYCAYAINRHKNFMPYDMIYPLRKLKFENYEFYAPNDSDSYIKSEYPDYLSMPETFKIAPNFRNIMKY